MGRPRPPCLTFPSENIVFRWRGLHCEKSFWPQVRLAGKNSFLRERYFALRNKFRRQNDQNLFAASEPRTLRGLIRRGRRPRRPAQNMPIVLPFPGEPAIGNCLLYDRIGQNADSPGSGNMITPDCEGRRGHRPLRMKLLHCVGRDAHIAPRRIGLE